MCPAHHPDEMKERDRRDREHVDVHDQAGAAGQHHQQNDEDHVRSTGSCAGRSNLLIGRRPAREAPRARPPAPARPVREQREVVAHGLQRVDRLLLHLRLHRMLRELSPFEQIGELARRGRRDGELREHPAQVLERRLGRPAWQAVRREHPLQPCVGCDHGAARIGLGAKVVERLVDRLREVVGEEAAAEVAACAPTSSLRPQEAADGQPDQRERDPDRDPRELGLVPLLVRRGLGLPHRRRAGGSRGSAFSCLPRSRARAAARRRR